MFFKKGIRAAAAGILAVVMAFSFPFAAQAQTSSVSPFTGTRYSHDSKFEHYDRYDGIDVSSHNGSINWKSVKKDGVDFAVIRAGFTGYTKSRHSINEDPKAAENLAGALAAGIPIGVYWYSQALNVSEARAEANKVLEIIKGYSLDLPVFFDYEFAGTSDGRLDSAWSSGSINKSKMTANARAFCEVIENAGYQAGIYASKNFLEVQLDGESLGDEYKIWLAHYTNDTDYSGEYYIWQYSSSGSVNGIDGRTDVNFMYLPQGSEINGFRGITGFNVYARGNGGKDIYLDWNDFPGADGYRVYIVSNGTNLLKGSTEESNFKLSGLTPGWQYTVMVVAYNNYESISSKCLVCAAPAPVENLHVESLKNVLSAGWSPVSGGGYVIEWSMDKTFSRVAGSAVINGSSKTGYDINVSNPENYYVRVRAWKNFNGETVYGDFSSPVKASVLPASPSGITVAERSDNGKLLTLEWNGQANTDGYRVYIISNGKEYLKGTTTDSRFKFTDLTPGWNYNVMVVAYNESGSTSAKTTVCAMPAVVENISARAAGSAVSVSWSAAACSGYVIEWSMDSSFTRIAGTKYLYGSGTTTYSINEPNPQDYYVRVRAWKEFNGETIYGNFSNPVKTAETPAAPAGYDITATGNGGKLLLLDWNDQANTEGYRVYIVSGDKEYLKGTTTDSQFKFNDLTPGWNYTVMVVAYNENGTTSSKTTVCAAPCVISADDISAQANNKTLGVSWEKQTCTGYVVQWSMDSTFTRIAGTKYINGAWNTSYSVNASKPQNYYVRVRAYKTVNGMTAYGDFSQAVKAV